MGDVHSPGRRSYNMSRIRGRDTKPEMVIRRGLHARGFRFRLQARDLPGRPDLVLPRHRAVVFVHGCFWHGHECQLFQTPATRREFWEAKIARNRERDVQAYDALAAHGWRTLTVWECAIRGPHRTPEIVVLDRCEDFLKGCSSALEILGVQQPEGQPGGRQPWPAVPAFAQWRCRAAAAPRGAASLETKCRGAEFTSSAASPRNAHVSWARRSVFLSFHPIA